MRTQACLLAAALLLTACSGCAGPVSTGQTLTPVAVSTAAITTPAPPPTPVDTMAVVSKFGDGLGANKFSDAGTYVAPGGAAERCLTHQAALTDAMQASGVSREAIGTVTVDKAAGTLTFNETGVVCTDWQVNTAGKIEGWTVKGLGPIASLMWTEDASGSVGGVEVKLVSAYANPEGLWVVLDITAGGKDIQPDISAILTDSN